MEALFVYLILVLICAIANFIGVTDADEGSPIFNLKTRRGKIGVILAIILGPVTTLFLIFGLPIIAAIHDSITSNISHKREAG